MLKLTLTQGGIIPGALDLWQAEPLEGVLSDRDEPTTVWRVDLPSALNQTSTVLSQPARTLRLAEAALPLAEDRLERFTSQRTQGVELFDGQALSPQADLSASAERQLDARLGWLDMEASEARSFGASEQYAELKLLAESAQGFLEGLRRSLTNFAWVETTVEGRVIARSQVAWQGDFKSGWVSGVNPRKRQQHLAALRIAIETRQIWIRIGLITASGATRLSTSLASGLGSIFAIPFTLAFIRDVLAEYQRMIIQSRGIR